ncbi:MAG: 4a-hydroxytetrahydrobiopterin dehydratase [Candidatus Paceibacterota bacterium]
MAKTLTNEEIQEEVKELSGWIADTETSLLQKEFEFENFSDAMVFVNRVAEIAEEENHHPDICVSYNSVVLMLTTHDAGGLTQRDFYVAGRIEELGG